jgi:hypothetical protein
MNSAKKPWTTTRPGELYRVDLGIQAVQHHELQGPLGVIVAEDLRNIRVALSRMLSLG